MTQRHCSVYHMLMCRCLILKTDIGQVRKLAVRKVSQREEERRSLKQKKILYKCNLYIEEDREGEQKIN